MYTYSFVIPVFNEAEMLPYLFVALDDVCRKLDGPAQFVVVDDGSTDGSWDVLTRRAEVDGRYLLLRFSRNFGHQVAVTAGLDRANGDAVVIMDADLQDPPEVVVEMARRWREGYDVVYGVRSDRDADTWFKRTSAMLFYRALHRMSSVDIPQQVGDFRLIDRAVVEAIRQMPERNRYVRGMFAWLGFSQIGVEYRRPARKAGETSFTLGKMLRFANDGVIGYSKLPLRAPTLVGASLVAASAIGATAAAIVATTSRHSVRPLVPWLAVGALGGAQLVALGLVGEYVSRIFDEALDRPLYVVREERGTEPVTVQLIANRPESTGEVHELFGGSDGQALRESRLAQHSR